MVLNEWATFKTNSLDVSGICRVLIFPCSEACFDSPSLSFHKSPMVLEALP